MASKIEVAKAKAKLSEIHKELLQERLKMLETLKVETEEAERVTAAKTRQELQLLTEQKQASSKQGSNTANTKGSGNVKGSKSYRESEEEDEEELDDLEESLSLEEQARV